MSHFAVMVIGNDPEDQLARYNEEIKVPEYEVEIVSAEKIRSFREAYTVYNEKNPTGITPEIAEENKKCSLEELYQKYGKEWNGNCWRFDKDHILREYSTYNPDSEWDWYVLGGRWLGLLRLKKGSKGKVGRPGTSGNKSEHIGGVDQCMKKDILNLNEVEISALVKEGIWYGRGVMGWWSCASDEKPANEWAEEVKKLLQDVSDDTLISIYDCHI